MPIDVRQRFLLDPVRAPVWRLTLSKFDAIYGDEQVSTGRSSGPSSASGPLPIVDFVWGSQFAVDNEPKTVEALGKRYSVKAAEFDATTSKASACWFVLVEGPKLFVCAKEDIVLARGASMFLAYGAGVWLMDAKAKSAIAAGPGKSPQCVFDNDQQLCVLETGSDTSSPTDGDLVTLRSVMQDIERQGCVDFELAGHTKDRPPEVQQGQSPDRRPHRFTTSCESCLHCCVDLDPDAATA